MNFIMKIMLGQLFTLHMLHWLHFNTAFTVLTVGEGSLCCEKLALTKIHLHHKPQYCETCNKSLLVYFPPTNCRYLFTDPTRMDSLIS